MRRRAFSLVELLAVTAILAVLAALLFPVFARSKEQAKLASCQSRLRQFAVALSLYRADHEDRGYVWAGYDDYRYPYYQFDGMKGYLGGGQTLWCPEPNAAPKGVLGNLYVYRVVGGRRLPGRPDVVLHVPFRPLPGTVVAYCENHATGDDPRYAPGALRAGSYPFVREDLSGGVVSSVALRLDDFHVPNTKSPSGDLRFPGEPWPPFPEE